MDQKLYPSNLSGLSHDGDLKPIPSRHVLPHMNNVNVDVLKQDRIYTCSILGRPANVIPDRSGLRAYNQLSRGTCNPTHV
jgi:hypothetical protein